MQRILVTGGAGFIGSNYVHLALQAHPDRHVVVLDKLTYAGNLANLADLDGNSRLRFVQGDIADQSLVNALVRDEGIDAIVNFAAETHVDRSVLDPAGFITTNVYGVYSLLEAARTNNVSRFLHVSTDEVYGAVLTGHSVESDPLAPRSPYASAKAGGDLLVLSYVTTYGLNAVVTRGSNTIGPYQYPEKATPLFITNAIEDKPLPIYGDGRAIRDYLFVEDHCRGIDLVLERGESGNIYNIGGGNEVDTIRLSHAILDLLGKPRDLMRFVEDRPGHDRRYSVDTRKTQALGWKPALSFDQTIERTVRWYAENPGWWQPIKSGEFRAYYETQYGKRLGLTL